MKESIMAQTEVKIYQIESLDTTLSNFLPPLVGED